jgi:hypothetical protein
MLPKFRNRRLSLSPATVLAFAALVFALGGFAAAAIPGSDGTIKACYLKKGGTLRVIDSAKRCAKGEKQLSWSQKGPAGPAGAKGDTGPSGPRGDRGEVGSPATKLWAAVRANGTTSRGSGVVSTKAISPGFYEVTFNQNVTQCDFIATLGDPDTLLISGGEIGAAQNIGGGFSNLPTQVLVATNNSAGAQTAQAFFLTVIC